MGAAFVTASADNLDLVGDSLAMSTAVFFLVRSGAATGRVCAFLGAGGRHIPLLECREQRWANSESVSRCSRLRCPIRYKGCSRV